MNLGNDRIAWLISNYLLEMGYVPGDYEIVFDWLSLCTNIKSVNFDIAKYDETVSYCGSAWDYAKKQSEIWERYNIKLVQFNYGWCALESLTELILPKKLIKQKGGKIRALCAFLNEHISIRSLPQHYKYLYEMLIYEMLDVEQLSDALKGLGRENETIDIATAYKFTKSKKANR